VATIKVLAYFQDSIQGIIYYIGKDAKINELLSPHRHFLHKNIVSGVYL